MMKKFTLLIGGLILVLMICLTLIPHLDKPKEEHKPTRLPLPAHTLLTIQGERLQIQDAFPNQDYLLLFFSESSETSLKQIAELTKATDFIPQDLTVLLIHLGRMKEEPPNRTGHKLHLLIDPEANLAQTMGVRCVPSLYLLQNNGIEKHFSETLVLADELTHWFLPPETQNHSSLP